VTYRERRSVVRGERRKDGYQVVFSLAELDPGSRRTDIIVADTIDGSRCSIQGRCASLRPHDKRGARSNPHAAADRGRSVW